MGEDLNDHSGIVDGGVERQRAATVRTARKIDPKHPFEQLGPQRGVWSEHAIEARELEPWALWSLRISRRTGTRRLAEFACLSFFEGFDGFKP